MIFDFISGEASTQEGGGKFAKWLAEDTDLTQKEKKSVLEKIKDFFTKLLDSTPEHTVRDEYAQEVLDTLRGMAITLPMSKRRRRPTTIIGTKMTCFFCVLDQKVLQ